MVMKREVNAKNKITAVGALAVGAVRCVVGLTDWSLEEMRRTERKN